MTALFRFLRVLTVCALAELLVPWALALTIPAKASTGVLYILFFMLDPLFAVFMGVYAGRSIRARWYTPFLSAAMFVLGSWIVLSAFETAFLYYGGLYLLLGLIGMFFSNLVLAWREAKKQAKAESMLHNGK